MQVSKDYTIKLQIHWYYSLLWNTSERTFKYHFDKNNTEGRRFRQKKTFMAKNSKYGI